MIEFIGNLLPYVVTVVIPVSAYILVGKYRARRERTSSLASDDQPVPGLISSAMSSFASLVGASRLVGLPKASSVASPRASAVLDDLEGKNARERANIKANEYIRIIPRGLSEFTKGRLRAELRSRKSITLAGIDGIEFEFRAWRDDEPLGFGRGGVAEIERWRMLNVPLLVEDPDGPILRTDIILGVEVISRFREDPVEAMLQSMFRTIDIVGKPGDNIQPGRVASTTLTVFPEAGTGTAPIDGFAERQGVNETYANIHDNAGTNSNPTTANNLPAVTKSSTTPNQFEVLARSIFGFPTAAIPDDDIIDSATMQLTGTAKTNGLGDDDYGITAVTPASESDLVDADYNIANYGSVEFATRITQVAWDPAGLNTWTFNASGLAEINKTANTIYAVRSGWGIDNSFGGIWASNAFTSIQARFADFAGTASDPVLTVEHTTPDAPGPSSTGIRMAIGLYGFMLVMGRAVLDIGRWW